MAGMATGVLLAVAAVTLADPAAVAGARQAGGGLSIWLVQNLGHASWLFLLVLALFLRHLNALRRQLEGQPEESAVVELDQLTDVWIQVFVGVGVVWTAVGMRSALQVALADPQGALADSAGTVLGKLVDGGILLALTTTIVGAVGGYLMRLGKTLCVGAALHQFHAARRGGELRELLASVQRLETAVGGGGFSGGSAGGAASDGAGSGGQRVAQ